MSKISLDMNLIMEKAKNRDEYPGVIAKAAVNYRKTRGAETGNCYRCEHARIVTFKNGPLVMCSLLVIRAPEHDNDKSCIVDEFHLCDGYNTAKGRQNIKKLLKEHKGE